MSKSKEQLEADKRFDDNYERIFGSTPPEDRKGHFRYDPELKKLVRVSEEVEKPSVTIFFKGNGWPNKQLSAERRHRKGLERDPFYTTLPEYAKQAEEALTTPG